MSRIASVRYDPPPLSTSRSVARSVLVTYPPVDIRKMLPCGHSISSLKMLLRRAFMERPSKDSDQFRHVFQMFGRPKGGVTAELLHRQLAVNFGVKTTLEVARDLFGQYDRDRTGAMPLAAFIRAVLPKDYVGEQWNLRRDREIEKRERDSGHRVEPHLSELPKSLHRNKPTLEELKRLIQLKIVERTKRASDQYREAYKLFGSPSNGISPTDFKHNIQKLGVVVTDKEVMDLFLRFDTDGSGVITFSELVGHLMPKDYTRKPWAVARDEDLDRKAVADDLAVAESRALPPDPRRPKIDVSRIEDELQRKIIERTKRPEDQYREAYAMFGNPAAGITKEMLGNMMFKLGMHVTKEELNIMFPKYDKIGAGFVMFPDLLKAIMPPDYPMPTWTDLRDKELEDEEARKATMSKAPILKKWPKSLARNRWSLEHIESLIQEKIQQRTKRACDQYREAYALFGSPAGGISPKHLKEKLTSMGLVLDDNEVMMLFDRYDTDGSGLITFSELVAHLMPKDYTRKPWNIVRDDENDKLFEEKRLEFLESFKRPDKRKPRGTIGRGSARSGGGGSAGGGGGLGVSGSVVPMSARPSARGMSRTLSASGMSIASGR